MLEAISSATDPWMPILFRILWVVLTLCLLVGAGACIFVVVACRQALRPGHTISECHQLGVEKLRRRRRRPLTAYPLKP